MSLVLMDSTQLDAVGLGSPVEVQPDNGLVSAPPIGTTTADTPSQVMELASYGVTSDPSLSIPPYTPSSNYANNIQGMVQGLFGQLPVALGLEAPTAEHPAPPPSQSALIGIAVGALAAWLLFRKG